MDEVHCVTEWGSSSNNKNRSAFRVWYFRDSRNFNYAILTPVDLRHLMQASTDQKALIILQFRKGYTQLISQYITNYFTQIDHVTQVMNQILYRDWLSERARRSYLACTGLPAMSRKKNFFKSHILYCSRSLFGQDGWI